ncbi:MAG TPA: hypothetical protein VHJ34_12505 [Actinomycetota bacterium]|nr:hypothetical protein [Actinomycetota bacterium]
MTGRIPPLEEGWYLMSTGDLERELRRWREPDAAVPPSNARRLERAEALAYRDAGNLPDELGRTLRLVLVADDARDVAALDDKRRRYEPDYHRPPTWRRAGSAPVNVVPLRAPGVGGPAAGPWWEQADVAELESEWRRTGAVAGVAVPREYRSFVLKTVAALRAAGEPVTPDSIADSIARWLAPDDAARIRAALRAADPARTRAGWRGRRRAPDG